MGDLSQKRPFNLSRKRIETRNRRRINHKCPIGARGSMSNGNQSRSTTPFTELRTHNKKLKFESYPLTKPNIFLR